MRGFHNRGEAGRILARDLQAAIGSNTADAPYILVLGLPRGGVPVAFEVARGLAAELDVFLVRKLGVPGEQELALGAIASGGVRVLNRELIEHLQLSSDLVDRVTAVEQRELERREQLYREGRPCVPVKGRTVVLVDDGLATGASIMAAIRALRPQDPLRIIVAVPVATKHTCGELEKEVDQLVCLAAPQTLGAVGLWYEDFRQVSDDEVRKLLDEAAHARKAKAAGFA
jgi:putative phosphoribosyl transferase